MRHAAVLVVLTMTIGGLAACGDAVPPGAAAGSDGTNPATGGRTGDIKVQGVGTVLESPEHGPQLCLGGVADSLPPQCGGPDLLGWDWATVDGAESAQGTTWGEYAVTGTWDGERLTVTKVDAPEDASGLPSHEEPDFASPCPPPDGGWAVVDAATATDVAMQRALELAAGEPDYAGAWVDQSINPAYVEDGDVGEEQAMLLNDPTKLVLNVMFTGDLERHEAELRAIWGGALCLSDAPRTEAELLAIQQEVQDEPGVLGSVPDPRAGTLEVSVIVDDGLQERMDQEYGAGVVVVVPSLQPVG